MLEMELKSVVLVLLGVSLALIWYFFAMSLLLPLGIGMFILCRCILGYVAFKTRSTEIPVSLKLDVGF